MRRICDTGILCVLFLGMLIGFSGVTVAVEPKGPTRAFDIPWLQELQVPDKPEVPMRYRVFRPVHVLAQDMHHALVAVFPEVTMGVFDNALVAYARADKLSELQRVMAELDRPVQKIQIQIDVIEIHDAQNQISQFWSKQLDQGVSVASLPDLSLVVQSLLGSGRAKLLANPSMSVMDKKTAVISVGDKIPYATTVYSNGVALQQIQQVDTGISIEISPRIVSGNHIEVLLTTKMNRVRPGTTVQNYPVLASRQAATTIRMPENVPVLIAGLLDQQRLESQSSVPLLSDIPILGDLFRYTSAETVTTDVVLRVTSRILPF